MVRQRHKSSKADRPDRSNRNSTMLGDMRETENSEDEFELREDRVLMNQLDRENARAIQNENEFEHSDDEVMRIDEDQDSSENEDDVDVEESEEEEDWSRKDFYGADNARDEEDAKLEEEEVRRLQKKKYSKIKDSDIVDDLQNWKDSTESKKVEQNLSLDDISSAQDSREERLRLINSYYPSYDWLRKDFLDLSRRYCDIANTDKHNQEREEVKILSAYLSCLAIYFAFLSNADYRSEITSDHPINSTLLHMRQAWMKRSKISKSLNQSIKESCEVTASEDEYTAETNDSAGDSSDLDNTDDTVLESIEDRGGSIEKDFENALNEIKDNKKPKYNSEPDISSAFREPMYLNDSENLEKERRRKNLKFFANQISQKDSSNKRKHLVSDDVDLGIKERKKEAENRLLSDAKKRGVSDSIGEDLSYAENALEDHGDSSGSDLDLYESTKKKAVDMKIQKKQLYELEKELMKNGYAQADLDELSLQSKRKISREIMKNKGLAPKRAKENRNPRVKRRNRYEKAQKKLASQKSIYKGKPDEFKYHGEHTGIKKGLVKSIKLK